MGDFRGFKHSDVPKGARGGGNKHRGVPKSKKNFLSRFERGRLPVAARLIALLWIVFFYSLNIPKKVDFRGFKHSDVPKGARGGGNKHRGVLKSKNIFIALRAGPAARLPALLWIVFFYSLNIPKMVDFRGFKHSDVPKGGRGGGNKHRGVQKSKHLGWGP
ncbi:hypothetical protein ACOMHN_056977 [Nucella lapillus]